MAQKRPTTLIRIQHLHNYCVIIIFLNIIILIYYYTYYYYLLLSLLYGLLLSYYYYYYYFYTQLYRFCLHRHISSRSKTAFACFFLVYARLTPPSWQMLQIQAGFTMTFWEFVIYSLRTGNHDQ